MPSPTSLAKSNFCYRYGCYPYQPSNEAFLPENRKEGACRYQAGSAYFSVHVSVRLAPPVNANGLVEVRLHVEVFTRRGADALLSPPCRLPSLFFDLSRPGAMRKITRNTRYQMRVPIRRGHQFARSPPIG
ncbi:hypothetical protein [Paraburkholderia sp. Cpub6]|uniref:hypothetical protein n=1 Tax=Paraburkholderia sp. Cpub6 TaxID=2723094 RepID=UPI0016216EBA|nr:hypothetical protein [Paraburkholderia sp. Cpub6]MBB5458574.1 hypothetical protein [Paraburkholderia sp. Cpub6]